MVGSSGHTIGETVKGTRLTRQLSLQLPGVLRDIFKLDLGGLEEVLWLGQREHTLVRPCILEVGETPRGTKGYTGFISANFQIQYSILHSSLTELFLALRSETDGHTSSKLRR